MPQGTPWRGGRMRIDTKLEAKGISAALYLRTSTKDQTVENQRIKLREFAKAMEWAVVAEYADQESGVESAEYRKLRRSLRNALERAVAFSDGRPSPPRDCARNEESD